MRISVVTPTSGRNEAMRLSTEWLWSQTKQPDEWIVASGSTAQPGLVNFRENLVDGLRRATGDLIVMWEDDDYYRGNHIAEAIKGIEGHLLFGVRRQLAYDLRHRRFMDRVLHFAPLCAMSFRREFLPVVIEIAESMNPCLELAAWAEARKHGADRMVHTDPTVVGLKGMPGTANVSDPNAAGKVWVDDPDAVKLGEWLGSDAQRYEPFLAPVVPA